MSDSSGIDYNDDDIKTILKSYIEYLKENPIQYCVSGLDYSSLYPSLIMTYNLSPEYLILDKNYKEEIEKKGYNIHNINSLFLPKKTVTEKNIYYFLWENSHGVVTVSDFADRNGKGSGAQINF